MNRAIELYLQTCGKPYMHEYCGREPKPGEIMWIIETFSWDMIHLFFQVVSWKEKGNLLTLELWEGEAGLDDGIPRQTEEVSGDISLEELHIKLREAAKTESIKFLTSFIIDDWEKEIAKLLAPTNFPKERQSAKRIVKDINETIATIKHFAAGKDLDELTDRPIQYLEGEVMRKIKHLQEKLEDPSW